MLLRAVASDTPESRLVFGSLPVLGPGSWDLISGMARLAARRCCIPRGPRWCSPSPQGRAGGRPSSQRFKGVRSDQDLPTEGSEYSPPGMGRVVFQGTGKGCQKNLKGIFKIPQNPKGMRETSPFGGVSNLRKRSDQPRDNHHNIKVCPISNVKRIRKRTPKKNPDFR